MKKIYSCFLLLLFVFIACEDNKKEYLDEFETIVYFLESGEIDVMYYKTGENGKYTAKIIKAGYNTTAVAEASLSVMDAAQLAIYNTENYTDYELMPASCYSLPEQNQLSFASNDTHKAYEVELITDKIHELGDQSNYVLPLYLSSQDSVNSNKNVIFIKPEIAIPLVSLEESGYFQNIVYDSSADEIVLTMTASVPFENKWSFDCIFEVDPELLDEFNESSLVYHSLLSPDAYKLKNDGKISFEPGSSSQVLEIKIEKSKLGYNNYLLPIRLASCTHESFEIDQENNVSLFAISFVPDENKLSKLALRADMLSTNAQETSEGSLANLLDGDITTYFHSRWQNGAVSDDGGDHYVQVSLAEAYEAIKFEYTTRSTNGSAAPAEIIVSGSSDGVTFRTMAVISDNLPTQGAQSYVSAVILGSEPCNIFRFTVTRNTSGSKYFVWSEFSLHGL